MSESGEIQSSLVRELMAPSPSLPFELKRRQEGGGVKSFPVRVRVLRPQETEDALVAAQEHARKRGEVSKDYGDVYREAQAVEILVRAVCQPELADRPDGTQTWRRMFVSADQMRSALFEYELAQLLNCYEVTKAHYRIGPQFTEEQLETFVDKLSDEFRGPYFLAQLDSADVPELIFSLAREVAALWQQTGRTPSGSPSTSGSTSLNSEIGTTEFSELPDASSSALPGMNLPNDKILTRDEARALVKAAQAKPDGSE